METVILWTPSTDYSCETLNKIEGYNPKQDKEETQYIVQQELRRGKPIHVQGPNLENCLRRYAESHNGKSCEIILISQYALRDHVNPSHVLSELLELGYKLFGHKFLLRIV